MDSLLHLVTVGVFFLTAVVLVAGALSYLMNCYQWKFSPEKVLAYSHVPKWDQNYGVSPRHAGCRTCEIQVVNSGGELVGSSSME